MYYQITRGELDSNDVFSLWTFLARLNSEFNTLAFSQSLEASASNSAEVSKNVWAIFLFNKTETFCFVEPLNYASCLGHFDIPE
tara:strand:- start:2859 stop:3110 length:252 start_codon:yes stop_codon:yes gene_type:complete